MSRIRASGQITHERLWRGLILSIISVLLFPGILALPAHAASRAETPAAVTFPDETLVRDESNGAVYLDWASTRHRIANPATLDALGYARTPINPLDHAATLTIPNGSILSVHVVSGGLIDPLSPINSTQLSLNLSQPSAVPGQGLMLTGNGFQPSEAVTVTAPNIRVFPVADGAGNIAVSVPVPASVSLGLHHIFVRGNSTGNFGVEVFHVIQPAAVQLAASPSTVAPGASFSVSGSGFLAGERVQLVMGTLLSAETGANAAGTFGPFTVLVPSSAANTNYPLTAFGASSARSAATQITVSSTVPTATPTPTAALTITPATINAGGQVVVSGSGFQPGEQILIRVNTVLNGNIQATSAGAFTGYLLSVPTGTAPGSYTVQIAGASSGRTASGTLTVNQTQPANASIAISPLNAIPGTRITVAGTGFTPGETVTISFNNSIVGKVTVDGAGSFSNGAFIVPANLGAGRYGVAATGQTGLRTANAVLTVSATPVVVVARAFANPSTIVRGGTVRIVGTGFAAHETVLVRIDGLLLDTTPLADGAGAMSLKYTANIPVGPHTVTLFGATSRRGASTVLRVTQPITAMIGVSPGFVHHGTTVTMNGRGFGPGETVLIRFGTQLVWAPTADGNGNFANVRFPVLGSVPYGAVLVTATGANTLRQATARIVVLRTAPSAARIKLSHGSVHRGDAVTVSGSGFLPGETVLVRFNNNRVQQATVDRAGNFGHATFHISVKNRYGTFVVTATGQFSGRMASAKLSVTVKQSVGISVIPTTVLRGHYIIVYGHGFKAGETALIYVRGRLAEAATVDRHGNFRKQFQISADSSPGSAIVMARGLTSHRHAQQAIRIA